ncbi:MAG: undecaprenyl-phosphate glucose phosphotransferase [Proteocatella sp.]
MIKENQKLLNYMNILTDALVIVLSLVISYILRFEVLEGLPGNLLLPYYFRVSLIMSVSFLALYSALGLYDSFRNKQFVSELGLIIKANIFGTLLFLTIFFLFKIIDISRMALVFFLFINITLTGLKRYALRVSLRRYRKRGYNQKHVLLIGSGNLAREYIEALNKNKSLGFHISGYISDKEDLEGLKYLGDFDNLADTLDEIIFDEVVAALEIDDFKKLKYIIESCEKSGTKISVIPFYAKYMPARPYVDEIEGIPLINVRRIPLDNMANAFVKRMMDIAGSLILILLTSPIMIFAALGTKISSPGPVIFKQHRVGLNKKNFTMYKFRSMRVNDSQASGWTTDSDPRKTRFGSFIRKFSIDELPQFFNVLFGDMSLVGPRPELPHFVDKFKETIPLYMVKHQVRPGITGWAQVCGFRGDTSIKGRIEHDIYYIENWSALFDIKIIFMTAFKGMVNSEKMVK